MHIAIPVPAPPISNVEAEAALLGALMIENRLIDRAADIVSAGDFAEPFFGRVFGAIMHEHEAGHAANPVTLLPYFTDDPGLAQLGGRGFFAQLTGSGAAVIGAMDFARQVAELAGRRRFADRIVGLGHAAANYENTTEDLAADAEGAVADALSFGEGIGESLPAHVCIERALNQMADAEDGPPGVSCGLIPSLDHALGTIRPGHLIILASRPGMGKTATALSYSHGAARQGFGTLIASLEMRAADLGGRLACDVAYAAGCPVPYATVTDGGATYEQRRAIARAGLQVKEWPLWIEDLPSATVGRLGALVRRAKRRFHARGHALALVVVDYLQLVRPDERERDLYQAISAVSRGLKALAKAEGVGLMALCQLSRSVEARADKRPQMADLRDSGQIEQDADAVCFLLRREEYSLREQPREQGPLWDEWHEGFEAVRGQIEFAVPKRRFGRPGTATGQWLGAYQAVRG